MNQDEIKKDMEYRRLEAAKNYFKSSIECNRDRKRKIVTILIVLLSIIFTIKFTIGRLVIPIKGEYNKNRLYEVKLNGKTFNSIDTLDKKRITIVPELVYLGIYRNNTYYATSGVQYNINTFSKTDKYLLDIFSYKCYSEINKSSKEKLKFQSSCNTDDEKLIKELVNDEKYKLVIAKDKEGSNYRKVLYKGNYIRDISEYLNDQGYYYINIVANRKNVETEIVIYMSVK